MRLIIPLLLVGMVSATLLGFVNLMTKDRIEAVKLQAQLDALKEVLPDFDNDPVAESDTIFVSEERQLIFFPAKKGEEWVAIAVKSYSDNAFSGYLSVLAGFEIKGKLLKAVPLEHKETPGLGDKMERKSFQKQFYGVYPQKGEDVSIDALSEATQAVGEQEYGFVLKVKKEGGNVDAITAATISSKAFCDALQRAVNGLIVYNTNHLEE